MVYFNTLNVQYIPTVDDESSPSVNVLLISEIKLSA